MVSTVAIVCGLLAPLALLLGFIVICRPRAPELHDGPRRALDPTGQSNLAKVQRGKYDKFTKAASSTDTLPSTAQNTVASSLPDTEMGRSSPPASHHAVTVMM
jgi:hypothetical protein